MTGFGRGYAECPIKGVGFEVEISSVNRKQLEIRPSLPRELSSYEPLLRSLVSSRLKRGSVGIRVNLVMGEDADAGTTVNHSMLQKLIAECSKLTDSKHNNITLDIGSLLTIPGVVETKMPDVQDSALLVAFKQALEQALNSLIIMRKTEGSSLKKDLLERLVLLQQVIEQLEPLTADVPARQKERLLKRLKEAELDGIANDDERMMREIVFFTDRCDVSEEITRLRSHCSQMEKYLCNNSDPVGRSIDFLLQEMFREINTLGNKAASSEVSPLVVALKTELEKMREQAQNVE
jgi:uncharacterized protein (TIGR00255 family)